MEDSCYVNEEEEGVVSPELSAGVVGVDYSHIEDDKCGINYRRIDNGDGWEDAARAGPVDGLQRMNSSPDWHPCLHPPPREEKEEEEEEEEKGAGAGATKRSGTSSSNSARRNGRT